MIALDTWKENVSDIAVKIAKGKSGHFKHSAFDEKVNPEVLIKDTLYALADFFAGNALPAAEDMNQYAKELLTAQRDLE